MSQDISVPALHLLQPIAAYPSHDWSPEGYVFISGKVLIDKCWRAEIWRELCVSFQIEVAVKSLSQDSLEHGLQEFLKEASSMQSVSHKNIVTFYGIVFQQDKELMLVRRYCHPCVTETVAQLGLPESYKPPNSHVTKPPLISVARCILNMSWFLLWQKPAYFWLDLIFYMDSLNKTRSLFYMCFYTCMYHWCVTVFNLELNLIGMTTSIFGSWQATQFQHSGLFGSQELTVPSVWAYWSFIRHSCDE